MIIFMDMFSLFEPYKKTNIGQCTAESPIIAVEFRISTPILLIDHREKTTDGPQKRSD